MNWDVDIRFWKGLKPSLLGRLTWPPDVDRVGVVANVIDVFARRIIDWRVARSMRAELVILEPERRQVQLLVFGQQRRLASILTLDESLHPAPACYA